MVYRYAEMLLLMADVYNELDNTFESYLNWQKKYLKRARESAGGNGVEPKAWSKQLTKEEVSEKIYFEFLFELDGEPSMYELLRVKGTVIFEESFAVS